MSDKPTTGETNLESEGGSGDTRTHKRKLGAVSSDSIPTTTGEWGIDNLGQFYVNGELQVLDLIDAHNAALALKDEALQANRTYTAHVEQQLAAEQEKVKMNEGIEDELREANQRYYDAKIQIEKLSQAWLKDTQQLKRQLAAAVEALKQIHDGDHGDVSNAVANFIVELLAKIGGKEFNAGKTGGELT